MWWDFFLEKKKGNICYDVWGKHPRIILYYFVLLFIFKYEVYCWGFLRGFFFIQTDEEENNSAV